MLPSKYRNGNIIGVEKERSHLCLVSGILAILEKGTIIMDSGEGSYGQLYRMLGPDGMQEQLQRTKAIFISHMHADHHLGTIQILLGWRKVSCHYRGQRGILTLDSAPRNRIDCFSLDLTISGRS